MSVQSSVSSARLQSDSQFTLAPLAQLAPPKAAELSVQYCWMPPRRQCRRTAPRAIVQSTNRPTDTVLRQSQRDTRSARVRLFVFVVKKTGKSRENTTRSANECPIPKRNGSAIIDLEHNKSSSIWVSALYHIF